MQYLGYLVIVAAFYAGFTVFHPISIIVFALVSTLIFASARARAAKKEAHSVGTNPLLDGVHLFALQALIMFTVYILGYFMSTTAGDSFIDFFTGRGR